MFHPDFAMFNPIEPVSQLRRSQRAAERYAQLTAIAEPKRKPAKRRTPKLRVKPVSV